MAKRMTRGPRAALTSIVLIAAIAVGALLFLGSDGTPAEAANNFTFGVDVDSSGNTATSLGTPQACRVVTSGTTFDVDIYISGNVDNLVSWETYVRYNQNVLHINKPGDNNQNNNSRFLFQQAQPVNNLYNTSETLPDTVLPGKYRIGAYDQSLIPPTGDSGQGVLLRMEFQAIGNGYSDIRIDTFANPPGFLGPWFIDVNGAQINDTSPADNFFDGPVVNGSVLVGTGSCTDTDGDGVPDSADNCPTTPNPTQLNTDGDSQGDACDSDDDNDGLLDTSEPGGCSTDPDCDDDLRSDGPSDPDGAGLILAGPDNCITVPNSDQLNTDGDSMGDACDPDDDGDGLLDTAEPSGCSLDSDCDNDLISDGPNNPDGGGPIVAGPDNCVTVYNPTQANADGDAFGDACDDSDSDGFTELAEGSIGTLLMDNCGNQTSTSPFYSQAWPADVYSAGASINQVDIQDIGSFIAPVPRFNTSPGDAGYNVRWDVKPGASPPAFPKVINLQDLGVLVTTAPPMFNNQQAFGHAPCTP